MTYSLNYQKRKWLQIVDHKDAAVYMQRQDLNTGYRRQAGSFILCIKSILQLHNNTMNIWSAFCCIVINIIMGTMQWNCLRAIDNVLATHYICIPSSVYFWLCTHTILRVLCWIASILWHIFEAHSESVSELWCTLDFIGIYISLWGMGCNAINILCLANCVSETLRFILLGTQTICVFGSVAMYLKKSYIQDNRSREFSFFIITILYYIPIFILGWNLQGAPLKYIVRSLCAIVVGCICYFSRFPESLIPYYFDLVAPSHSLWHWCSIPHDIYLFCFTWEILNLALRGGFTCEPGIDYGLTSIATSYEKWY
jgi:adiponectin receptor